MKEENDVVAALVERDVAAEPDAVAAEPDVVVPDVEVEFVVY